MDILETIQTETRRLASVDRQLTTEIAEYLAAEAGDDMCRLYVNQAEEILAMVRDSDRVSSLQASE